MPRNVYEPLKTYFLKVNINCQGCKSKVKKTLRKVEGVYSVDIDTDQQAVIVRGNLDPEVLVKKLNKRGKHAQLMFLTPYQFGNQQAALNHENRTLENTKYNFGSNQNNVPSYERTQSVNHHISDEEMMMNMMKPVMMNDADYFEMKDSPEDIQELFGEVPRRRHNNYEESHPNLMRDIDLGYSNAYPAAEAMNMGIGGRVDNMMMMNEKGFRGRMMNGPSLVPQSMNHEQFSSRPLHGYYY